MKVGVFVNPRKDDAKTVLKQLLELLDAYGMTYSLETEAARLVDRLGSASFYRGMDVVIALGGDGTMLETVHRMDGLSSIPIAGINIGTLGFLTTSQDCDLSLFVKSLRDGDLVKTSLTLLDVMMVEEGGREHHFRALNEVTVMRGTTGRLISIEASIDGKFITQYKSDGLIVATPTGSTAYSLAAGGPLIAPHSGVFVINPICPHTLSNRALVVPNTTYIELSASSEEEDPIFFTVDGRRVLRVEPRSLVKIKRAEIGIDLLQMADSSYYKKLRSKLGWSGGVHSKPPREI